MTGRLAGWLYTLSVLPITAVAVLAGFKLTVAALVVLTVIGAVAWWANIITGTYADPDHVTFRPWLFTVIPFFLIVAWCTWLIVTFGILRR